MDQVTACHRDPIFSKIGLELTRPWPLIAPTFFFILRDIARRILIDQDICCEARMVLLP